MSDILLLVHRIPFPPDKGEKIRAYHVLRHLAETHRVHLGCFVDDPSDLQHVSRLDEFCASKCVVQLNKRWSLARGAASLIRGKSLSEGYFHNADMATWVRDTMARVNPENIFVFCSAMAPYVIPYAGSHNLIVDMVDVDSEKFRAYAGTSSWPLSALYKRESRALLALERNTALAARQSYFVSQAEADTFLSIASIPEGRVGYFHNGVNYRYFNPDESFESPYSTGVQTIVFTGTMDYRPNVEAVEWFSNHVFPNIRRQRPSVEFWIVGANPSQSVVKLGRNEGTHVTGRVHDVRPYLANASCVVAPLLLARGVQNKVLEAMAMARPVVASPAACEGLSAVIGRDLLVAETPEQFCESVSMVLSGGKPLLGDSARKLIETDYDWSGNLAVLNDVIVPGRKLRRQAGKSRTIETGAARESALT